MYELAAGNVYTRRRLQADGSRVGGWSLLSCSHTDGYSTWAALHRARRAACFAYLGVLGLHGSIVSGSGWTGSAKA